VRFEQQAKFHPLKYLAGLLDVIGNGDNGDTGEHGVEVFEQSGVDEIADEPLALHVGPHRVTADFVVIATHQPLMGKANVVRATLLQTDLYAYSTYALSARMPARRLPEALYWDTSDPYYYLRVDAEPDGDVVIFGGLDHKTGQADDTRDAFAALRRRLAALLPEARVSHQWSGQVIETRDGLPYIGETSARQFAATGFAGNGITFATLSAMMARDRAIGRTNPWSELFDIGRTRIVKGLWDYLRENKDYPYYLIRDRFAGVEGKSLRALARGSGRLLEIDGRRVAAYRAPDGSVTQLSPFCTHMGCIVDWNEAESTWDCPCHGSRFLPTGDVMAGPAETPLKKK
jgi:Rieske Fe-S protein